MERVHPTERRLLPTVAAAVDWLTFCFAGESPFAAPPACLGCPRPEEGIAAFARRQNAEAGWPIADGDDRTIHLGEAGLLLAIAETAARLGHQPGEPLGAWS